MGFFGETRSELRAVVADLRGRIDSLERELLDISNFTIPGKEEEIRDREKLITIKDTLLGERSGEVDHLREQVRKLQDSLLAVQHPEAYRQVKDDELAAGETESLANSMNEEERKAAEEKAEFVKQYFEESEKPLFTDPEDMMDKLARVVGIPQPSPVHDNEES